VQGIEAVFSDLDDTLTEESLVHPDTYRTLWDLKDKGYRLAIISGRPAGWADCLMRVWPLDAMVFENGAGYLWRDGKNVRTQLLAEPGDRKVLQTEFDRLKKEIPALKLAADQPYRRFDFAIDFAEEPPFLDEAQVEQVMASLARNAAITAKLSSIHVNYWCGKHTKVTASEHLLARWKLGKEKVVFFGDSPNDEPLFAYFPASVGVANIAKYLSRLKAKPSRVTKAPGGRGFQEVAAQLPRRS
jgi:HAD superfamily hydrolase (TIGR01484 family)